MSSKSLLLVATAVVAFTALAGVDAALRGGLQPLRLDSPLHASCYANYTFASAVRWCGGGRERWSGVVCLRGASVP